VDDRHDGRDYHRLLADIERHRLAGILFATPPFLVAETPIVTAPGIPRAAIMTAAHQYPAIPKVSTTEAKFAERAVAWLRDQGRHRLAVLCADIALREWQHTLARLVPQYGLEHRPYWLQAVHLQHSECGRRCLHLMFQPEQGVRPDALIIADDNLLEAATTGLVDAGVAVPQALSVVAHANFPWPTPAQVPVRRLGYDAGDFLRLLLQAVDDQRRGATPIPLAQVAPLFDDEYHARHAAPAAARAAAQSLSPVHLIP
jgi:DNA-binding LacI/PurR family transcriptional regulator